MNVRAALVLLAGLPTAAAAQEIVYSWTWHEVFAGTSSPVAVSNGQVSQGEGARLVLTAAVLPGIGSPATYQAPPGPGHGTIAGLGSVYFDLLGTTVLGGTWSVQRRSLIWSNGPVGTPQPNGDLIAAGAGQFVAPGTIANSANPVGAIWAMTWTPAVYTPRLASFRSQGAAAGQGNHSNIIIQYGVDPNTGEPLYVDRFVSGQFGNTPAPIPIVPAPGVGALVCIGGLALARRGRPRQDAPART